jgi:hypothetical protein
LGQRKIGSPLKMAEPEIHRAETRLAILRFGVPGPSQPRKRISSHQSEPRKGT